MDRKRVVGILLVTGLLIALASGSTGVTLVKEISGTPAGIGRYIIEDIQMCEDGQYAIMVGVANSDDAHLYKFDLNQDKVVAACDVGVLYGPRGTSGLAVNFSCTKAYVPNYPTDTVSVIDLTQMGSPEEVPECASLGEIPVLPKPTDAALTYPDDAYLCVPNSFSDTVTIIDSRTNTVKCEVAVGFGPSQCAALGRQAFYIPDRYSDDVAVVDPNTCEMLLGVPITGLDRVPQAIAVTSDGKKAYVADFVGNMIDVIYIPAKAVVKKIPVGESPRYITCCRNGRFCFVSNTIDKTISVINTDCDCVVDTIEIAPPNEPAPIGVIAPTNDCRYLYVFYTGGRSSTYADFVIFKYSLCQLYGG